MADEESIEVTLEDGRTVQVEPHAIYVIEVGERDYWRDETRHREGALVEVPGYALPSILEARPPFGRLVGDLDDATSPDLEPDPEPEATEEADEEELDEDEDPGES